MKIYQQMMDEVEEINYEDMVIIGDDDFVESTKSVIKSVINSENSNPVMKRKSLDEILENCGIEKEELYLIRSGSGKRALQRFKKAYALNAIKEGYTYKQIGSHIKLSDVAIHRIIT